jgi:hypothetical protein
MSTLCQQTLKRKGRDRSREGGNNLQKQLTLKTKREKKGEKKKADERQNTKHGNVAWDLRNSTF